MFKNHMKLLYYLKTILIILFLNLFLASPQNECGAQDFDFNLNNILLQNKRAKDFIDNIIREDYWAPISFHVIRSSNLQGGIPLYRLEQGINDLN